MAAFQNLESFVKWKVHCTFAVSISMGVAQVDESARKSRGEQNEWDIVLLIQGYVELISQVPS